MLTTRLYSVLVLFFAIFFLVNTVNAAGVVGNIIPETGEYSAIDKNFTVTLPIKGKKQYVLKVVTDTVTTRGTLISIEPRKGAGTYRLETSNAVATNERNVAFPEASAKTFDWYRRLAVRAYRSNLTKLLSQSFEINGRKAASVIYKQLSNSKNGPRFHLFYLVDFNDRLAFVWTDIPLEKDDLDLEEQIITGKAEQAKKSIAMLRSLKFN